MISEIFQATVVADLPEQGEYGLEVFANSPEKDGDMFTHVCQYLVAFTPGRSIASDYGHVSDQPPLRRPGTAGGKGKGHEGDAGGKKKGGVDTEAEELLYKAFTDTPDDGWHLNVFSFYLIHPSCSGNSVSSFVMYFNFITN